MRDESLRAQIAKESAQFDARTAKLRALRLAKEAEDKIAADKAALEAPPKKVVKKRVAKVAAPVIATKKIVVEAESADEDAQSEAAE